jgi:carbamoyltransferase
VFDNIWIQPAAGDAGGALGAATFAWYQYLNNERAAADFGDSQHGSYLGPEFSDDDIKKFLADNDVPFEQINGNELPKRVSDLLASEKVVGWFQGRMEFGPRALGARSIIGDSRSSKMQETMNLKIKFRESFRPFAPSTLAERVSDYFEMDVASPYMLLVADVVKDRRRRMSDEEQRLFGIEKLNIVRSDIPAITHVDYSARVQTVHKETNERYHQVISQFEKDHGCAVIINTSFNVRGEPIVCTPEDAYRCFMRTKMDYLVLGNFVIDKTAQPELADDVEWMKEFELD